MNELMHRDIAQKQMADCNPPSLRYNVTTIRERLEGRMAYHQAEIDKLATALTTLTPEIEKAMDALSNVSY